MKRAKKNNRAPRLKAGLPEILDLRERLAELEETLNAIRSGEVDALIVNGPNGDQVYSLKGAEAPYRAFIEHMHEGAVTLSDDATVLYCNKRFADMVGLALEKVIGKSLLPLVMEEDRPLAASLIGDNAPGSGNVKLRRKKGGAVPVRLSVNPLADQEGGGAVTRCLVVTDLTEHHERKMLSEALKKLQTSQSKLQAQYEEVQAVQRALEEASAAKDDFLAALSHELRTPLTPVLLTANAMAVDPSLPGELRGDLDMIRRNVELEARLIDDLLDLTRITRGKLTIAPKPVDLHEMLMLALDICRADTVAKGLRFVVRKDATFHYVSGEAVRLQQVFWNLIRNAMKFTPQGGTITVTTKNPRREGNETPEVIVTVSDTGLGISPDARKRIFNAFEQGSGDITRRYGGLGLGLTISKRLVDLHGGMIGVASDGEGKGATFTVALPTIAAPLSPAVSDGQMTVKPAKPLRILLVEDHDDTRRNMTRLLTALNHTVVPAHDAKSALEQAESEPFDLVVSDIGLPDESGLELMKKLRERHGLRGICLSGYGMEQDIAKSMAAGFSEHLTKPISFERLENAIAAASMTG
jgi:PAS domain S-box-containing protein